MNEFCFSILGLGNAWNLNFDFKFQVFLSRQDRKTNSFVRFLGEVTARQFFFEIYWPLERSSPEKMVMKERNFHLPSLCLENKWGSQIHSPWILISWKYFITCYMKYKYFQTLITKYCHQHIKKFLDIFSNLQPNPLNYGRIGCAT